MPRPKSIPTPAPALGERALAPAQEGAFRGRTVAGERRRKDPRTVFICTSVVADYLGPVYRGAGASGARVRTICGLDDHAYRTLSQGRRLTRWRLRAIMYALYPLRLVCRVLVGPRRSICIVTSNTFFAPALVALVAALRGSRVVHLLYDLYPDALEVAGAIRPGGVLSRCLGLVARANQRWPACVVYLGKVLQSHTEQRWGQARRSSVVAISADTCDFPAACPVLPQRPLRLHYGGQLGQMHDGGKLTAALRALHGRQLLGSEVEMSFRISGNRARWFAAEVRGLDIEVQPTLPTRDWRAVAMTMHIGLVTLSQGGATVCLPSKTYAMMASGMAIIAICPGWSDLANLVRENEAGWVIDSVGGESGTATRSEELRIVEKVASAFSDLVAHLTQFPREVASRRQNAHRAAHDIFGSRAIERQWLALCQTLD